MKLGFTNGQQFKSKVRALAKEKQIDPQILMQEVVLDEIVDRISCSQYRDHLILKGGFLRRWSASIPARRVTLIHRSKACR